MEQFWRNVDLKKLPVPKDFQLKKDRIVIKDGTKEIQGYQVFYREASPSSDAASSIQVLLLHGKWYSSRTWLDLGTLHLLGANHRTVAIDVPGFGNSPGSEVSDKPAFLDSVLKTFDLWNPVVVSPSMGGFYTLPYIVKHWRNLAGYVPVSPHGIEPVEELPRAKDLKYKNRVHPALQSFLPDAVPDLSHIQVPTLNVFGEHDRTRRSALLDLLPLSQSQEIPNGSHPAYLDNPDLWHQLLYNFLQNVSQKHVQKI